MTEFFPVHLTNRLSVQVQGRFATYHPRGWVTRIAIQNCPQEFTLLFNGKSVAHSIKGEIAMAKLDEDLRKSTRTSRLKKALPSTVRKRTMNLNRIKDIQLEFDKAPPAQNYWVVQDWFQLLNRQCEPFYNNVFNQQFIVRQLVKPEGIEPGTPYDQRDNILEKQKDFADFYGTDKYKLPAVKF